MGGNLDIITDGLGNSTVFFVDKGGENINVGSSLQDFQIIKELGKGNFGSVSLVRSVRTNKLYAMKAIRINRYTSEEETKAIEKEIKFMENLHHPHVITYFTSFREKNCIYIVTEYINGGSLLDLIELKKQKNEFLEENKVWDLLVQSLSGLLYLHEVRKIIHRDIKPDNILLDQEGHLKISDFGVSAFNNYYHKTLIGPIPFMSPEMAQGKQYNDKSDIYMLGLTFFYVTSYQLFDKKVEQGKNFITIVNPKAKMSNVYSKELRDFIYKLLTEEPEKRPSSREAYKDAFANYALKYLKITCIGSLLQCLNCVVGIRQMMVSNTVNSRINNTDNNQYLVTKTFNNTLKVLNTKTFNSELVRAELIKFRLILLLGKERFESLGEVDISSFCDYLLIKLHMELSENITKSKLPYAHTRVDFTDERAVIKEAVKRFNEKYNSKISDNFCYLSRTTDFCNKCGKAVRYSCNLNFTSSYSPDRAALYVGKHDINVTDLFIHYGKKRLYVDESLECKKCKRMVNEILKVKNFYTSPNTIIMMLTYQQRDSFRLYIDEQIDISKFVERLDISQKNYYLVGVVYEKFQNENWSYYSISRKINDNNWIFFNGYTISKSFYSNINSYEAGVYPKVLFYSFC